MSEGAPAASPTPGPTAGRLLREARERQGLHIAALAASIKVTPRKLELLESDRFDLLPDATFARALAQTVCRALKIDSTAVMRLLPPLAGHRLEQVGEGLNAPFRDRPGLASPLGGGAIRTGPAFWATVVVLGAAFVVYFMPGHLPSWASSASGAASAAESVATPASAALAEPESAAPVTAATPTAPVEPAPTTGAVPATPSADATSNGAVAPVVAGASPAPAAAPAGILAVQAAAASWVEVIDGRGQVLLARVVQPGEAVGIDGPPPFKLRIGNAEGTRIVFRGQPIELAAFTRDNIARLELK
ncbi:MAG: helix-turn-helix domain-containing protein [Caldimonas sp.]